MKSRFPAVRLASCHAERRVYSLGLCRGCYELDLKHRNPGYALRQIENRKAWGARNPERVKALQEKRITDPKCRARDAATRRAAQLRKYGLAESDYLALVRRQRGRCAICKKTPLRTLAIDHCHQSGRVRGLLCFRCNYGLSWFQENAELLARAARHVR